MNNMIWGGRPPIPDRRTQCPYPRSQRGAAADDSSAATDTLRDAIATMRWGVWVRLPPVRRADVVPGGFARRMQALVDASPAPSLGYERQFVHKLGASPDEVFAFLDTISITPRNAFLLRRQ